MIRLPILLAAIAACAAPAAAQTVRFQTSVGSFDITLNPSNNANLQPHVDNFLAGVGASLYNGVVVNRADAGFVLQIGSFQSDSSRFSDIPATGFEQADNFDPLIVDADGDGQVDFSTAGLSNTPGTVSLALAAGNPNSGALSFFVNVGNNAFLDAQGFVPFAEVSDLTVVNQILSQPIVDISADVGQPGSLAFIDVPQQDNGDLILVESATVISNEDQVFIGPVRQQFLAGQPLAPAPADDGADGADGDGGFIDPFAQLSIDQVTALDGDAFQALAQGNADPNAVGVLAQLSVDQIGALDTATILDLVGGVVDLGTAIADLDPPLNVLGPSATALASTAIPSASIPEPGAATLVCLGLLAGAAGRRR